MKSSRAFITVLSCVSLAGCSSIGTINGVSLDQNSRMGSTETTRDTWCDRDEQHRWICILLAAGVTGGAIAAMLSRDDKKAPPAAPVIPSTPLPSGV